MTIPMRDICREIHRYIIIPIGLTLSGFNAGAALPERLEFFNLPNLDIHALRSFPDRPSANYPLEGNQFQFPRLIGPSALIWFRGYLQFPQSGQYRLFIEGNDRAELWISPNKRESNVELQAFSQHFSNRSLFNGLGLDDRTTELKARKGEIRYFEIRLFHLGPSSLRFGWELPDGTQEVVPGALCFPYPRAELSTTNTGQFPAIPNELPSWDSRVSRVSNITVTEGDLLKIEPALAGAQPMTFQWYRDDVPLAGEVLARLQHPISLADEGTTWTLHASNEFGTTEFSYSPIVLPDQTPPQLFALERSLDPPGLKLTFTEPITPDTATNWDNYSINRGNFIIDWIEMIGPSSVLLEGDLQRGAQRIQLQISGIKDRATQPNTIEPVLATPSDHLPGIDFLIYEGLIPEQTFSRDEYPVTRLFEEEGFPDFPTTIVSSDEIEFHSRMNDRSDTPPVSCV